MYNTSDSWFDFFQFRIGHNYLCGIVKENMELPTTVVGADGVTRTYTVPASIKAGKDGMGANYWSETEWVLKIWNSSEMEMIYTHTLQRKTLNHVGPVFLYTIKSGLILLVELKYMLNYMKN